MLFLWMIIGRLSSSWHQWIPNGTSSIIFIRKYLSNFLPYSLSLLHGIVNLYKFIKKDLDDEEHKDDIELISSTLSVCAVGMDFDEEADRDLDEDLRQARKVMDELFKNTSLYLDALPDEEFEDEK